MSHALVTLVGSYGLLGVFVLMAAESCGLPIPSEVVMPVGGALAAAGHLDLVAVIVTGAFANLAGSLAAYGLAARFGTPLLLGPGRRVGFSPAHLELAGRWFGRYGLLAVLFGRVLPVVRTYISFPAGLARVRLVPFAVLTVVGALPWNAALALAGYVLRNSYEQVSGPIQVAAIVIAVLALIGLAAWYVRGRRADAARTSSSRR